MADDLEGVAGLDVLREQLDSPLERMKRRLTPTMRRCLVEMALAHPARSLLQSRTKTVYRLPAPRMGDQLEQASDFRAETVHALWGEALLERVERDLKSVRLYALTNAGRELGQRLVDEDAKEASDG